MGVRFLIEYVTGCNYERTVITSFGVTVVGFRFIANLNMEVAIVVIKAHNFKRTLALPMDYIDNNDSFCRLVTIAIKPLSDYYNKLWC